MYWNGDSKNNLLSYFGLVDAKIRVSDNHSPVQKLLSKVEERQWQEINEKNYSHTEVAKEKKKYSNIAYIVLLSQ